MLPQILRRTLVAISMSVSGEASVIDDTLLWGRGNFSTGWGKTRTWVNA
jgi:hypothetical protein